MFSVYLPNRCAFREDLNKEICVEYQTVWGRLFQTAAAWNEKDLCPFVFVLNEGILNNLVSVSSWKSALNFCLCNRLFHSPLTFWPAVQNIVLVYGVVPNGLLTFLGFCMQCRIYSLLDTSRIYPGTYSLGLFAGLFSDAMGCCSLIVSCEMTRKSDWF